MASWDDFLYQQPAQQYHYKIRMIDMMGDIGYMDFGATVFEEKYTDQFDETILKIKNRGIYLRPLWLFGLVKEIYIQSECKDILKNILDHAFNVRENYRYKYARLDWYKLTHQKKINLICGFIRLSQCDNVFNFSLDILNLLNSFYDNMHCTNNYYYDAVYHHYMGHLKLIVNYETINKIKVIYMKRCCPDGGCYMDAYGATRIAECIYNAFQYDDEELGLINQQWFIKSNDKKHWDDVMDNVTVNLYEDNDIEFDYDKDGVIVMDYEEKSHEDDYTLQEVLLDKNNHETAASRVWESGGYILMKRKYSDLNEFYGDETDDGCMGSCKDHCNVL
eukprot:391590_1